MIKKNELNICFISKDPVFVELLSVMFKHQYNDVRIIQIESFLDLKSDSLIKVSDLIIVDDIVADAGSLEVISYLRLERRVLTPICFFAENVYDMKIKALRKGANYYYKKPFDPTKVVEDLLSKLSLTTE